METLDWKKEIQEVRQLSGKLATGKALVQLAKKELHAAQEHIANVQEAQQLLQHWAQAVQQQAHQRISTVVTSCLQAVFPDDPYTFSIAFERKRGRTEATLQFERAGMVVNPIDAAGGGVVDVAAFALRIACLVLHRPKLARVVILDEPFRFVSAQYLPNVRAMLEQLSEDLKLQIIMATHIEELSIGKVIAIR